MDDIEHTVLIGSLVKEIEDLSVGTHSYVLLCAGISAP